MNMSFIGCNLEELTLDQVIAMKEVTDRTLKKLETREMVLKQNLEKEYLQYWAKILTQNFKYKNQYINYICTCPPKDFEIMYGTYKYAGVDLRVVTCPFLNKKYYIVSDSSWIYHGKKCGGWAEQGLGLSIYYDSDMVEYTLQSISRNELYNYISSYSSFSSHCLDIQSIEKFHPFISYGHIFEN